MDDQAVDTAKKGEGERDEGLGAPGAGRGLRRRPCCGPASTAAASEARVIDWYLADITGLYWSNGHTARHTVSRRPGKPRREMCAWPEKAPEALSDGDIQACLTSEEEPS